MALAMVAIQVFSLALVAQPLNDPDNTPLDHGKVRRRGRLKVVWRSRTASRNGASKTYLSRPRRRLWTCCASASASRTCTARRHLDFLAEQAEQALARRNETRKAIYTVLGGIVMLIAGYVGAAFKNHL